ncbi:PEP-CTERM sorting domain-containing protein [Phormidesmis sp. 146-35]
MSQLTRLSILAGVLSTGAIALTSTSAQAASFTAQDAVGQNCVGQQSCLVNNFFKLSANPSNNRQLTQKTVGGILGIGVAQDAKKLSSDSSQGEIDLGESLKVDFKKAGVLESLQLSFLYQPGVYFDQVFEAALVTAGGVLNTVGKLTVTSNNTAVWSLPGGSVVNVSPSLTNEGGSYNILNPFGKTEIAGFSLTPVKVKDAKGNYPSGSKNSDFALSAASVHVPEPATLAGLGVVGLLAASRRRKAVQG